MALRKKLYYNVAFLSANGHSKGVVQWRRISGNPTRTNYGVVAAEVAGTINGGSGASDPDVYGNVLAPIEPNGIPLNALSALSATVQQRRSRQTISAWFQASAMTSAGFTSQGFVAVDFIAPVASLNSGAGPSQVAAALALTDPTQVQRPWVRLRRRGLGNTSNGVALRGRLYVQRQHSVEC